MLQWSRAQTLKPSREGDFVFVYSHRAVGSLVRRSLFGLISKVFS